MWTSLSHTIGPITNMNSIDEVFWVMYISFFNKIYISYVQYAIPRNVNLNKKLTENKLTEY